MQLKTLENQVREGLELIKNSARDRSGFSEAVKMLVRREVDDLKGSIQAGSAKFVKSMESASPKTVAASGLTMLGIGAEIGLGDQLYNLSATNLLMHKAAFGSSYVLVNVGAFMAVVGLAVAARKHEERSQATRASTKGGRPYSETRKT